MSFSMWFKILATLAVACGIGSFFLIYTSPYPTPRWRTNILITGAVGMFLFWLAGVWLVL